jgi:HEPN domain-containing protein
MDRSADWLAQAERDLAQARESQGSGRHEWACFAAQQAAEKAVKALHLSLGQEAL